MRVILASNSPRRRELLAQVGVDFTVVPSGFEEKVLDLAPNELVKHFAYMKALDVVPGISGEALIIGSDTVVFLDEVMGKPKDSRDAFEMLRKLSGRTHEVLSGVSVIHNTSGKSITEYECTRVRIKPLSDEEISRYIGSGEPADKAGAYAIQGLGSLFVEGIEGDYFNVVGLPLFRLARIFERFGVKLL